MNMLATDVSNNILLVNTNCPIDDIYTLLADNIINSPSYNFYTARYRGTKVLKENNQYRIVCWQKNIARMQNMDVFLPTIIDLTLDNKKTINSIVFDPSFAGSQGISCCFKFLNKILIKQLLNQRFDFRNIQLFKENNLHCLHIQEILLGALSFLNQNETNDEFFDIDESEGGVSLEENNNIYIINHYSNNKGLEYSFKLIYHDYKDKFNFSKDGYLSNIKNLKITFQIFINEEMLYEQDVIINGDTTKKIMGQLIRFMTNCWYTLNDQIRNKNKYNLFFNTNMVPKTIIGLMIQTLGIVVFRNNYNYIQHILNALQTTSDQKPLCIGAVKNIEAAQKYFPLFDINDLY